MGQGKFAVINKCRVSLEKSRGKKAYFLYVGGKYVTSFSADVKNMQLFVEHREATSTSSTCKYLYLHCTMGGRQVYLPLFTVFRHVGSSFIYTRQDILDSQDNVTLLDLKTALQTVFDEANIG